MSSATEKLTRLVAAEDRFDYSHAELRETQLEALNERFQERKDRIKLLGHRVREAGTGEIRSREDMVPLLFPHSVYKSYPESFLIEEKWDRLGQWLGAVSPYPISPIETADVADIDDWIERLQARGHYVFLLERHDRQVGHAARLGQGHGLVPPGHGQRLRLGFGRPAGPRPADDGSRPHRRGPEEPGHRAGAAGTRSATRPRSASACRSRRSPSAR